jgi:hypothetical protein
MPFIYLGGFQRIVAFACSEYEQGLAFASRIEKANLGQRSLYELNLV